MVIRTGPDEQCDETGIILQFHTELTRFCGAAEVLSQWIQPGDNQPCSHVLLPAEPTDKFKLEGLGRRKVRDRQTDSFVLSTK